MDENETIYLEDMVEEVIGNGLEYLIVNKESVKPGSDAYTNAEKAIEGLYGVRIRYTEAQMKFDDAEAQRKHEIELEKLRHKNKMEELACEQEAKVKLGKNEDVIRMAEVGSKIIESCIKDIIPALIYNSMVKGVAKCEYGDNAFFNSSSWKMSNSASTKMLN